MFIFFSLPTVRDKYGDVAVKQLEDGSSCSESSSEEEDEDAEALTPQVERDFLRTLSLIKSKDPRIYDKEVSFFTEGSCSHCLVKGRQCLMRGFISRLWSSFCCRKEQGKADVLERL